MALSNGLGNLCSRCFCFEYTGGWRTLWSLLFKACGFLILSKLLRSPSLTAPFHQKHMEVRGKSLGAKLPHHQRDLTPVISGMVRQMLRQVRQTDLRCANGKHSSQGFVGHAIHELGLFFFKFRPLSLHRSEVDATPDANPFPRVRVGSLHRAYLAA